VKFYWNLTIGLTSVEVGDELLQMAFDLFSTIHSHAFTKAFVENTNYQIKWVHKSQKH